MIYRSCCTRRRILGSNIFKLMAIFPNKKKLYYSLSEFKWTITKDLTVEKIVFICPSAYTYQYTDNIVSKYYLWIIYQLLYELLKNREIDMIYFLKTHFKIKQIFTSSVQPHIRIAITIIIFMKTCLTNCGRISTLNSSFFE